MYESNERTIPSYVTPLNGASNACHCLSELSYPHTINCEHIHDATAYATIETRVMTVLRFFIAVANATNQEVQFFSFGYVAQPIKVATILNKSICRIILAMPTHSLTE